MDAGFYARLGNIDGAYESEQRTVSSLLGHPRPTIDKPRRIKDYCRDCKKEECVHCYATPGEDMDD
jgi:hypothetical protein